MLIASLYLIPLLLNSIFCALNQSTTTPSPSTDQELTLPSPSTLRALYDSTVAVLQLPWTEVTHADAESRQDPRQTDVIGTTGVRITLGAFFAILLATVFGVVGFGSVGLLAAKALAVGTLALFLTALTGFKKHKSDSGGQTVHYVPIQGGHHHDFLHDRSEYLPPYIDRNV